MTITKAITINCQAASNGGLLVSGTNGIVVAAGPSDDVQLIGLDINGRGPGVGSINGVNMTSAGATLHHQLSDLWLPEWARSGPGAESSSSGPAGAHVLIQHSIIRDNTNGVVVLASGATSNTATIDHTIIDGNLSSNVLLMSSGGVVVLNASSLYNAPNAIANVGGPGHLLRQQRDPGAGTPGITTPLK